jgi:hypothetical protein
MKLHQGKVEVDLDDVGAIIYIHHQMVNWWLKMIVSWYEGDHFTRLELWQNWLSIHRN